MSKVVNMTTGLPTEAAAIEKDSDFTEALCNSWKSLHSDQTDANSHLACIEVLSMGAVFWHMAKQDMEALDEIKLLAEIGLAWAKEYDAKFDNNTTITTGDTIAGIDIANVIPFNNNKTIH